jgi:hypothetical protein
MFTKTRPHTQTHTNTHTYIDHSNAATVDLDTVQFTDGPLLLLP